jgi:hypothetical protein
VLRWLILFMLAARVASADPAAADSTDNTNGFKPTKGAFGLGLILGEPTGICAKLYLANDRAIDVEAGFTFIVGGFQLSSDYLFHPAILQDRDSFVMPFYIGPGIRLIDYSAPNNYFALGLRGVVGLAFDFKQAPIDAFVEAGVVLETGFSKAHEFGAALNASVGARYYF